jgi:hypothetical protein
VTTPRDRLLVCDTITGRKLWDLPFTALSWNSPLNKIGDLSATLPIEATLERIRAQGAANPRNALRAVVLGPYRFCLVVAFGNAAVCGGPLLPADDEDDGTITVGGAGMEKLLENRVLLNRALGITDPLGAVTRDITAPDTNAAGAILALAAAAVADYDGTGSRRLPISISHLPDTHGDQDFSWPAYDLNTVWKAISDLVALPDGPDVRLEPILYQGGDGAEYVTWDLQIGEPTFPASGNYGPDGPLPWTWDDTVAKVKRSTDVTGLATSYFGAGSGQDRDKVLAVSNSDRLTELGFPALEKVDTSSSNDDTAAAAVQARTDALIDAHQTPTDSWNVDVPVAGIPQLGQFRRGDQARLNVRKKLLIEPGYYTRRITKVAGTGGSHWATVTCDYEDELEGV